MNISGASISKKLVLSLALISFILLIANVMSTYSDPEDAFVSTAIDVFLIILTLLFTILYLLLRVKFKKN